MGLLLWKPCLVKRISLGSARLAIANRHHGRNCNAGAGHSFNIFCRIVCLLAMATILFPNRAAAHPTRRVIEETSSITFINPSIGWRLGQRWNPNTSTYGRITIWRTNDGGPRWHFVSSLPAFPDARIAFADYRDGWIYGSRLYSTHDGGSTWRRISLHGWQTVVTFSGTSVWRLDTACRGPDSDCHLTLLDSTTHSD